MSDTERHSVLDKHLHSSNFSSRYEYVIVFPMEGPVEARVQSNTAKYVVRALKRSGMETFSYKSIQDDELIVLLRCPVKSSILPLKSYRDCFFLYRLIS